MRRELSSVSIEIYQPRNYSPLGLVDEAKRKKLKAKRERNAYNEIWVVLDKNGHANLDRALNKAKANKIDVALSIICFEYWVLLHFEKTSKPYAKCNHVIKYIKENHFREYEKCSNCYAYLKDKIPKAIANGKWLEQQVKNDIQRGIPIHNLNAYTNMHHLVEKLFNPSDNLF